MPQFVPILSRALTLYNQVPKPAGLKNEHDC